MRGRTLGLLAGLCLGLSLGVPLVAYRLASTGARALLASISEDEAVRLAEHLRPLVEVREEQLILGEAFPGGVAKLQAAFRLWKLKVFLPTGEVAYSTDPKDLGSVNQHPYFRHVVARGEAFTELVQKGRLTLEGQLVLEDVVEAYVPILDRGRSVGVFEVYYEISERVAALERLLRWLAVLPLGVSLGFLAVIGGVLWRASRAEGLRARAEEELRRAHEELEARVEERTRALEVTNRTLVDEAASRRAAEAALADEKERLAVALGSIADAVATTDLEGRVTFLNPVAEALAGCGTGSALGCPLGDVLALVHPDTRAPVAEILRRALAQEARWPARVPATIGDGGHRFEVGAAPLRDGRGELFGSVVVCRDVTELRRAEAELARAERLDSIALLAGGIAHDFNNLLTAVTVNLSHARLLAAGEPRVVEKLGRADAAVLRAQGLSRQLLAFAQGGAPVKTTASLEEVIRDSAAFGLVGSNVRCEFDLPGDLWPVEVDVGQVGQVVENLVVNADQAMPRGGVLRVTARNVGARRGGSVRLTVEDTGTGIAPEHLPRVFDPYFTTKSKGTGLGLATAYFVARRHGGTIEVESEVGRGSRFHLTLPASARDLEPVSPDPPAPRAGGHVLLMDDEEILRDAISQVLADLGYRVATAGDGAEAVTRYRAARAEGDPFDVVLLDLTVPGGMGGLEALGHLREVDPAVKAVASSGYSGDAVLASYREHGFAGVLPKPYRVDTLLRVLGEVMGG